MNLTNMNLTKNTNILLALTCALVVGCSDSNDPPANETSMLGPGGDTPTVLSAYNGTYLQACTLNDPLDPSDGAEVTTVVIAGDLATTTLMNYSDEACATPDLPAQVTIQSSIAYPGGTVQTDLGIADFVDLTPESFTVDGQPPSAEEMTLITQLGLLNPIFDILLLDGSTLYSGDDSDEFDGESAANRPVALDLNDVLVRQ
ncbi:MAG: hypothetical protein AB8B79_11860 [Granulosicoccus sp.]